MDAIAIAGTRPHPFAGPATCCARPRTHRDVSANILKDLCRCGGKDRTARAARHDDSRCQRPDRTLCPFRTHIKRFRVRWTERRPENRHGNGEYGTIVGFDGRQLPHRPSFRQGLSHGQAGPMSQFVTSRTSLSENRYLPPCDGLWHQSYGSISALSLLRNAETRDSDDGRQPRDR